MDLNGKWTICYQARQLFQVTDGRMFAIILIMEIHNDQLILNAFALKSFILPSPLVFNFKLRV